MVPAGRLEPGGHLQQFLMVGVLGGYTTFSAFSLQTLDLARNGQLAKAGGYIIASVALCLIAVAAGYAIGAAQASASQS